jgi:hypothetical protein
MIKMKIARLALISVYSLALTAGIVGGMYEFALSRAPGAIRPLGLADISAFLDPDQVEVYRLVHPDNFPEGSVDESWLRNRVTVSNDWMNRFRKWIAVQKDEGVGCGINPGFLVRFWKGGKSYDIALCFHCGQYEVGQTGGRLHVHDFRNDETSHNLIREIYPKISDEALYGLD